MKHSFLNKIEAGTANMKAVNEKRKVEKVMKKTAAELAGHLMPCGRRVIALDVIADQMWCKECNAAISLRFLEEEKMCGLSSVFYVRCHSCLLVKEVCSDRVVPDLSKPGPGHYASNLKCALGTFGVHFEWQMASGFFILPFI